MAFQRTQKIYDEEMLYEYAVGALGRKMRTVAELKRLMRERVKQQGEIGQLLVEVVVAKLKEQKYLNDTNYAESYSRFRKENEKFGRQRVVQDLKAKGVHGDIIEKTVGAAYQDVNEEQLAREYLQRKRIRKPATQKRRGQGVSYPGARGICQPCYLSHPEDVGRGRRDDHGAGERGGGDAGAEP